jgi:hypothetical protein
MGRIKVNDRVEMRGDMFGTEAGGTSLLIPDGTSGTVEKVYGPFRRSLTVAFDNGVGVDLAASEVSKAG